DPHSEGLYMGDPMRLKQILINLVGNSVKFTERGSVTLNAKTMPGHNGDIRQTRIDVIDTGIGIAPEKLGTIFDKFLQADSSITRRYGGTGLGLAITKRLVNLMNGTITV